MLLLPRACPRLAVARPEEPPLVTSLRPCHPPAPWPQDPSKCGPPAGRPRPRPGRGGAGPGSAYLVSARCCPGRARSSPLCHVGSEKVRVGPGWGWAAPRARSARRVPAGGPARRRSSSLPPPGRASPGSVESWGGGGGERGARPGQAGPGLRLGPGRAPARGRPAWARPQPGRSLSSRPWSTGESGGASGWQGSEGGEACPGLLPAGLQRPSGRG